MVDLSTRYMGLSLHNPIIAGSSSITKTADGVKRCVDAGAGAVVLKSLFEEQLQAEAAEIERQTVMTSHPEAYEYIDKMAMRIGPRDYLKLIEDTKDAVAVPVIASLNCISTKWWLDFASQIVSAGADAIEINAAVMPVDPERTSEDIEKVYYDLVDTLRENLSVPFAIKIGPFFTSMTRFARELDRRGVGALVLFNRFYQFDIDIDKLILAPGYRFSVPEELYLPLRWIAILAGRLRCDLAATTGVHDAAAAIKQLLAGATCVQVCSAMYRNQPSILETILTGIEEWMTGHGLSTLDAFRGKLSQKESDSAEAYERLQYIKIFDGFD